MKRQILSTIVLGLLVMVLATSITIAAGGGGGGRRGRGNAAAPTTGPRGPAPTLTAPATPTTRPDDEGFIRRWLVLEPMPATGVAEAAFRPVATQERFLKELTTVPQDGEALTIDGVEYKWHAYDSSRFNVNLYHFSYALSKPTDRVHWWVATVIDCPEEMKNVRLAIGSNDASIWWLNGEELIGLYNNRMDTVDDGVSKKVTLKKGKNVLRAAIANEMGPSDFSARILDANEQPVKSYTINLGAAK
jgi:hypothetical protein